MRGVLLGVRVRSRRGRGIESASIAVLQSNPEMIARRFHKVLLGMWSSMLSPKVYCERAEHHDTSVY